MILNSPYFRFIYDKLLDVFQMTTLAYGQARIAQLHEASGNDILEFFSLLLV